MFITFEGLDGSGKTTQARLLQEHLEREGRDVVATREPGGTPLGEHVRDLLLHGAEMSGWAEAALFAAARAELVERVVRPALARGATVVCDRFVDSSLAYQGIARGLGVEDVLALNLTATGGLLPDRTFLLLVDPRTSEARVGSRPDRIERSGADFRARADAAYRELAERFPERIVAIDGGRPVDEVASAVREALARDGNGLASSMQLRPLAEADRDWVRRFLEARWGSAVMVSRGRRHDVDSLPGFALFRNGDPIGLVTYRTAGGECELVTLDSLQEGRGVASALLDAVREEARAGGCRRLWLVTTNDNTPALRFYQRRGFVLAALHRGAVAESRQLKPEIPAEGTDGIPIRDELELELPL